MLSLTKIEQEMLGGAQGRFVQRAMENVVAYAKALGAEELCEVKKATLFFGAHSYLDAVDSEDYDKVFSQMHLCLDSETVPIRSFAKGCFCQTCASPGEIGRAHV